MKRLGDAIARTYRLWRYRHYLELGAPQRLDRKQVLHLEPGMTIRNPLGREPWILDLTVVSKPDAQLMVTLTAVQGVVCVVLDTWADILTEADLAAEASIVMDEAERLLDHDIVPPLWSNRIPEPTLFDLGEPA
jgi:hypothetical protein